MSNAADVAIDLSHVTKRYGRRSSGTHALRDVSLRVNRGEVFGLLGPNGAGKSTLIKIMMTVVRPTAVSGTLLGMPVGYKPTLARVGYLPEHHRFPRYLTGRQTLEFFAALCKVDRRTRKRRAGELVDVVGMSAWADERVGTYSKGMMQRIGIGAAMVNDPDLILLDEPTDGVDPVGRRDIRDLVGRLAAQGKTVFLNSHLLSELEAVCRRVTMLVGGQVVRHGTVDELTAGRRRYEVEVAAEFEADPAAAIWHAIAPLLPGGRATAAGVPVTLKGQTIDVGVDDPAAAQPFIDAVRAAGLAVTRVQSMRPSLEDLFIEAVVDPATGKARPVGGTAGLVPVVTGAAVPPSLPPRP